MGGGGGGRRGGDFAWCVADDVACGGGCGDRSREGCLLPPLLWLVCRLPKLPASHAPACTAPPPRPAPPSPRKRHLTSPPLPSPSPACSSARPPARPPSLHAGAWTTLHGSRLTRLSWSIRLCSMRHAQPCEASSRASTATSWGWRRQWGYSSITWFGGRAGRGGALGPARTGRGAGARAGAHEGAGVEGGGCQAAYCARSPAVQHERSLSLKVLMPCHVQHSRLMESFGMRAPPPPAGKSGALTSQHPPSPPPPPSPQPQPQACTDLPSRTLRPPPPQHHTHSVQQ